MRLFESLLIALSMYSAVPVPQLDWSEKNMRYAICFFPAVGVLCGAALWLWAVLAQATGMSGVLFAAIAACLPILVTGGIHMDGYLDTVDALSSHQTREKKLAIMKDANCGAFAVIYGGVYLLAYAGFAYEVFAAGNILLLCPLFVLSRALSGLCAVNLPNARKSGMLCAFTSGVQRRTATAALALAGLTAVATMVWMSPAVGGMAAAFAVVSALKYRRFALAQFGGVTGDTSGFFLQLCARSGLRGIWFGGMLCSSFFSSATARRRGISAAATSAARTSRCARRASRRSKRCKSGDFQSIGFLSARCCARGRRQSCCSRRCLIPSWTA